MLFWTVWGGMGGEQKKNTAKNRLSPNPPSRPHISLENPDVSNVHWKTTPLMKLWSLRISISWYSSRIRGILRKFHHPKVCFTRFFRPMFYLPFWSGPEGHQRRELPQEVQGRCWGHGTFGVWNCDVEKPWVSLGTWSKNDGFHWVYTSILVDRLTGG